MKTASKILFALVAAAAVFVLTFTVTAHRATINGVHYTARLLPAQAWSWGTSGFLDTEVVDELPNGHGLLRHLQPFAVGPVLVCKETDHYLP